MIENELRGPCYKQTQPSGSQKILLEGELVGIFSWGEALPVPKVGVQYPTLKSGVCIPLVRPKYAYA